MSVDVEGHLLLLQSYYILLTVRAICAKPILVCLMAKCTYET